MITPLTTAQAWPPPVTMLVAPLVMPLTATGVGFGVVGPVVVLLPSWPLMLLPQHLRVPAVVRAHENE